MPDFRCYAPDLEFNRDQIELSAFESHHLVSTNRARVGDPVILFNGIGLEVKARLKIADRKSAVLRGIQWVENNQEETQIILAVALTKGKTFDTILRQATEMGVTAIQPLATDHSQVSLKKFSAKLEKWQGQLVEACKQSGNPWLPKLSEPVPLRDFLKATRIGCGIVASLNPGVTPWKNIPEAEDKYTLFIGPEGDFSSEEYEMLRKTGILAVSLGKHVLRSETAVVAALAGLSRTIR